MTESVDIIQNTEDRMEPIVIGLVVIYSLIAIIGFTGNLTLVLITIKNKNLHHSCNIFIAISCFFDAMLYTDVAVFVFSMLHEISQEFCFYISIPADFGAFASNFCLLVIGIDRIIAVSKPVYYKRLEDLKVWYISILILFPLAYASVLLNFGFNQRDPERSVICLLPESLGKAYNYFAISSFFLNLFVPFIYMYVFIQIKKATMKSSARAVFRSLVIIVIMAICGWTTTNLVGVLTVIIPMGDHTAKMIKLSCGIFIFTSSSFNILVYYTLCHDYRNAIHALLPGKRFDLIEKRSTIHTN